MVFLRNSAVLEVDMAHILKFERKIPLTTYYGFFYGIVQIWRLIWHIF
jgi:hypothetical protein